MNQKAEPFEFPSLIEIKAHIPKHCFTSNLWTSVGYLFRDICYCFCLFLVARMGYVVLLPFYWFLQGTVFWALFVIAHDCGHGAFSVYPRVNDAVGWLISSFLFFPYTAWQLSHRNHHKNTGNIDKDEIFFPIRQKHGPSNLLLSSPSLRFGLGFGWFLYLLVGYQTRGTSHFNIFAPMFAAHRGALIVSLLGWAANCGFLVWWISCTSFLRVMNLYAMPLFIFASWLVITTFLHHNDECSPWYADDQWNYVKGNLSAVDRDYGIFHDITHSIGTHQIHHLFPIIPHYHLKEATTAFRSAFPHLVRLSDEPIVCAFDRIFRMFVSQMRIRDDAKVFTYIP